MAKEFGFYVADTKTQFILRSSDVEAKKLVEVKRELGFRDLDYHDDIRWQKLLRSHFQKPIPRVAVQAAEVWRDKGSRLSSTFDVLRNPARQKEHDEALRTIYEEMGIGEEDAEEDWAMYETEF